MSAVDRLLQAQLNALDLGLSQGSDDGMSKGWQTQRKRVEMGGEAAVQPPQTSGATAHVSAAVGPLTATQMTSSTSLSSVRASDARASSESRVVMPNALNDSHHRDRAAAGGGHRNELNGGPAIPSHTSTSAVRAHHPSDGPHSGAFPSHQGSPAVRSTSLSSSSASSSSTSSPQMGRAGMSTQSPKADPKPKRVFKAMTKIDKEKERAMSIAFGDLGRLRPPAPTEELNDRLSASLNDLNLFGRPGN